jgi:hypothetical protein
MAKKKRPPVSQRQARRMRTQQIIFGIIAFIVIASFVISLIA